MSEERDQERVRRDALRRRRLAEVFGETGDEQTTDDLDVDPDGGRRTGRGDTWLEEQVPPHHGG